MQGSVAADTIDAVGSPGVFELYERAVLFASFAELRGKLRAAIAAFPDLRPRLTPSVDAANARAHLPGPAYFYYTGCCITGSPVSRARDDLNSSGRLVTRLLSLWGVNGALLSAFPHRLRRDRDDTGPKVRSDWRLGVRRAPPGEQLRGDVKRVRAANEGGPQRLLKDDGRS